MKLISKLFVLLILTSAITAHAGSVNDKKLKIDKVAEGLGIPSVSYTHLTLPTTPYV